MLSIKNSSNVLVVVAHPDDEWWGLGGTLLRLKDEFEANISVIMVSDGERGDGTGNVRMDGSKRLCEELDFDFTCFDVPANSLRSVEYMPNITLRLDHKLVGFNPSIIFSHFEGDIHVDHKAVNECVLASLRGHNNVTYLQIETPFKYGFLPNFYVDISSTMDEKHKLYYDFYSIELNNRKEYQFDHIHDINRYHGKFSGTEYAEAFILKRGGF